MHALVRHTDRLAPDAFLSDLRSRRRAEDTDMARALPGACLLIALMLVAAGLGVPEAPIALPEVPMPRIDLAPLPQFERPRIASPVLVPTTRIASTEPARIVPVDRPVVPTPPEERASGATGEPSSVGAAGSGGAVSQGTDLCVECLDADPATPGYVWREVMPSAVHIVKPQYPDLARSAGVEGTVRVWALVGRDGRVEDVRVHASVPMLDEAALQAVRSWRFTPARTGDQPVRSWVSIPLRFRLHD